jgi:FkbM family methyltransferase
LHAVRRNFRWLQRALAVARTVVGAARGGRGRAYAAWVSTRLLLRGRSGGEYGRLYRLPLVLGGLRLSLHMSSASDLEVVHEIFGEREYATASVAQPRTVVDLGSHIGVSVIWFRSQFPQARILAVEPDPESFHKLALNTGELPGVELRECAITEADGTEVELKHTREAWTSSLGGAADRVVQVRGRSLDALLAEAGIDSIDLMKIDIEGSEFDVIAGFNGLERVHAIVGELHEGPESPRVRDVLGSMGEFDVRIHAEAPNRVVFSARRRDAA